MTDSIHHMVRTLPILLVGTAMVMLPIQATAVAAEAPIKEVLSSHIGWEIDETTSGKICTVESKDKCQPGKSSSQPGGFNNPTGIAAASNGNVYVADTNNNRVQELKSNGEFVLMFGWNVNRTKEKEGAPQAERNVCTAASGNVCQVAVEGASVGQFGVLQSIAVDPASGDVYTAEFLFGNAGVGRRVQKFTATGQFVLEIGREVNETTKGNLCTQEEVEKKGVKCKGPVQEGQESVGNNEPGAFTFVSGFGNRIVVNGPEDLLYVGDTGRVQEFETNGKYRREISLTSISAEFGAQVSALTVDKTGDAYLVYSLNAIGNVIREFDPIGKQIKEFPVSGEPSTEIAGIALDSSGHLAVTEFNKFLGSLYDGSTGQLVTEFKTPSTSGVSALAFNGSGGLYAVSGEGEEVIAYAPLRVAELLTNTVPCTLGAEHESDATFDCMLKGEVNPWGVSETEVWFQWGTMLALGEETPKQPIGEGEGSVPVTPAPVENLRPNATFYYRMAGYDHSVKPPEEALTSRPVVLFTTATAPPRIVGEPSASFVKSFSTVLFGELNPENANTEYFFEYGPCKELNGCKTVLKTKALKSVEYGKVGAILEAAGLQAGTMYNYRLVAENEHKERGVGTEGSFTTASAPVPQAVTGGASAVGTTYATVSGTVNPEGQPAAYTFELGIYNGANTQYAVVLSGSAGRGATPVTETLALSGLQPGTTYAYNITVKNGYGAAEGQPVTFLTPGLPIVLSVPTPLGMLPVPDIHFSKTGVVVKCKRGFTRGEHGKCIRHKKTGSNGKRTRRRKRR